MGPQNELVFAPNELGVGLRLRRSAALQGGMPV
jgi:hypothetical protein